MTLKALKDGQIKDMIHFDNEGLQSEVYANGVEKPGQLNWKWRDVVDQVLTLQNTSLIHGKKAHLLVSRFRRMI